MESIVVLLSIYNGAKYLREQINSIFEQQGVKVYLLIRDDGSNDNSLTILSEYIQKYPSQINLIKGTNKGFAESFSDLVEYAAKNYSAFEYFAFADQDDIWLPDKLVSGLLNIKDLNPATPNCYFSNTLLVDENLTPIGLGRKKISPEITKAKALVQNFATGCTMVFNKRAIDLYTNNRPSKMYVHDYWMFLICIYLGNIVYDDIPHIKYRQHSNNQIGQKNLIGRFKHRILKFGKNKHFFQNHSTLFLNSFKDYLSNSDRDLIYILIKYNGSILSKFKLLTSNIRYDNFEFNLFMRLKIFLGWL